jgi:RimJ/RimL family protein N-acetyltransferase
MSDVRDVVRTGHTSSGLTVDLVPFEPENIIEEPSIYDQWPADQPKTMPAELSRLHIEVTDHDGVRAIAGSLSWHAVWYGPNSGSKAWNIGIGLAQHARGHGIGTCAQRLLVEHLLDSTDVHRIEASTDVTNIAEQRSLEKAGFTREGIVRSAQERADGRHDLYGYSFIRTDYESTGAYSDLVENS